MAEPPPVGGQTGATTEPTTKPWDLIFLARASRSASVESMFTCGSNRNRSTPSNFWPSTSAAAVRSSIVSRPIGGSLPSPLPTTPGQAALCNFGKLLVMMIYDVGTNLNHYDTTSTTLKLDRITGLPGSTGYGYRMRGNSLRYPVNLADPVILSIAFVVYVVSLWLIVCVADFGEVVVGVGAEVAEADEWLAAGVFDFHAAAGRFVGDEDFVLSAGAEADHHRRLDIE